MNSQLMDDLGDYPRNMEALLTQLPDAWRSRTTATNQSDRQTQPEFGAESATS